ncbi:MAG: acid--CoA ligase [Magnetovibrio sp.]|nr:acid--CoA ligase [Magnetovibrio sp.]
MTNLGNILPQNGDLNKVAIVDCLSWAKPKEYTYNQINEAADACARGLIARGFKSGDAIAIISSNRAEFITCFMGILRAAMVAVPINFKFPPHIIQFICDDSNVKGVICDPQRSNYVPAGLPVYKFDESAPDSYSAMLDPGFFETNDLDPDGVAVVLYTSGSTGRPKGVPLTHGGHLWAHNFRVKRAMNSSHHRILVAAPLYHMNALCVSLFALGINATTIFLPEFSAIQYIKAIERFKCTWLTSVPTMLALCLANSKLIESTDTSSVRVVRMGSAPVSLKLWRQVEKTFLGALIMNGYGTTEAGPVVFGPKLDQIPPPISVGWPLPGVRLKLVNAEGKESEEGELWHHTPAVMAGYLNLPGKTAEVFSDDGLYKSGDVFRRDPADGSYYFVGRIDDMFNCGGENIYPAEIESLLLAHAKIEMACVVPVPDAIKGMKPVAFVVLVPGAELNEEQVKNFALQNAPAYQHPRMVVFLDELPLAGPGKVDRSSLAKNAREIWKAKSSVMSE